MLTTIKTNSIVRSILGTLLIAALLITTLPITAYAADNNPEGYSLEFFPALGVPSDTMDENSGTVNTLNSGGTIKDNKGHITYSDGTVFENHGYINNLEAGHVGTNYGTIHFIENTGSLSVNDKGGEVLFIGMGNVVDRNYGIVQDNAGTISENYGTVNNNYGTVIMHDGWIGNNYDYGTVKFEAKVSDGKTIPAKGTIDYNESRVEINSGTVTVKNNTGDIKINNATVTVEKNSGSITVGNNATLICGENKSGGVITKSSESAVITCTSNDGLISDETVVMYKIVFIGDDGQAVITDCDVEKDGVYYTEVGGAVFFTLPPEYVCKSAKKMDSGDVNTWALNAFPEEGDTEFTIICHKCSGGEYRMTVDKHWQQCVECGRILNEGAHTAGDYISDDNSTCIKDGTETYLCTECGYHRTRTVTDSHHTSNHHEHVMIDQRVEPTETSSGLTQGSHCEDCHKVLTAQEIIPKIPHSCVSSSDYLHDGSTHWKICSICNEKFDEETHNYGNLVLNKAATCNESATYYVQCDSCGAVDYTQIVAVGDPLGHSFGAWTSVSDTQHQRVCSNDAAHVETENHNYIEWATTKEPTETEPGTKERTCSVCGNKETQELPVLPPVTYSIISGANSEWTRGTSAGISIVSDAPFDKFESVKVDGTVIAAENYTAVSGSTKVTLAPAYLETVGVGTHSIEVVSNDGSASANFTVKAAQPAVVLVKYTVSFNMNGHSDQVAVQTIKEGEKATKPADPTASGYTFGGWYADAAFSTKFDFNSAINADTSVYAKWTKNSVTPADPTVPKTGDNSNMLLWAALLFVSSGALVGTAVFGTKEKELNNQQS